MKWYAAFFIAVVASALLCSAAWATAHTTPLPGGWIIAMAALVATVMLTHRRRTLLAFATATYLAALIINLIYPAGIVGLLYVVVFGLAGIGGEVARRTPIFGRAA